MMKDTQDPTKLAMLSASSTSDHKIVYDIFKDDDEQIVLKYKGDEIY
jgi:hypothetical protein